MNRKLIDAVLFVAVFFTLFGAIRHMDEKNNTVENTHFPKYSGVSQPVSRNSSSALSGVPSASIKSVNVSIKSFDTKAVAHQKNYELRQQTQTYATNQGLATTSSATVHSVGSGMQTQSFTSTSSHAAGKYNPTSFYNSVSTFQSQIGRSPEAMLAQNNSQLRQRSYSVETYRAVGGVDEAISYLDAYRSLNTEGLTDVGDGTYQYTVGWKASFEIWLSSQISTSSPIFSEIVGSLPNYKYYAAGGTPPPPKFPDEDPLPIGNGMYVLIALGLLYATRIAQRKKMSV